MNRSDLCLDIEGVCILRRPALRCAKLDPATIPSGNVKVTFGDVVYHTGVDNEFVEVLSNGFHNKQKLTFGERHFGTSAFSRRSPHPRGTKRKFPCATTAK